MSPRLGVPASRFRLFSPCTILPMKRHRKDARPPASPTNYVQLALKFPIHFAGYQTCAHRILSGVFQLLQIMTLIAHLQIPTIRLPTPRVRSQRLRDQPLPIARPPFDVHGRKDTWRAEEVDMVRHHKITADRPRVSRLPRRHERLVDGIVGQTIQAPRHTDGDEQDRGLIMSLDERWMRRPVATDKFWHFGKLVIPSRGY